MKYEKTSHNRNLPSHAGRAGVGHTNEAEMKQEHYVESIEAYDPDQLLDFLLLETTEPDADTVKAVLRTLARQTRELYYKVYYLECENARLANVQYGPANAD